MNSSHKPDLLDEVELLGQPGGQQLHIRFRGPFEGREVSWDTQLFTPDAWAEQYGEAPPSQNIILIEEGQADAMPLSLCLKVAAIDRPTVRKAVMMIRQYKRLQRGRHQYG